MEKRQEKQETQEILVAYPPYSESSKSWQVLVKPSKDGRGWSESFWIPKSQCTLEEVGECLGKVTMPKWLAEKILKELCKKFCISIKKNIFAEEYGKQNNTLQTSSEIRKADKG